MRSPPFFCVLPIGLACLIALGGLGLGSAYGEDELPATSEFFDEYDSNADGKVTQDEFRGSREVFRLLDKNEDGSVSPDELGLPADYKPDPLAKQKRAQAAKRGAQSNRLEQFRKRLMAMDADKDGRVSKAEWKGPADAFGRIDRNKDGFLDDKDRGGRPARGPGKGKGTSDGGMEGAGHSPGEAAKMVERAKQRFAQIDKNGDGQLSADELPNERMLAAVDNDKDGLVSQAEFLAFVKQRGQSGKRGAGKRDAGKRDAGKPRNRKRRGGLSTGMLRRWDGNRDGKVSPDEFPGADATFAKYDTDKDGFLTKADIEAAQAAAESGDTPNDPVTTGGGSVIEVCDTDGDGKLHRAEFKGSAADWRRLDKNADGWITRDELPAGK